MRKSPDGITTSDLVTSLHVGGNADLFPQVLRLHVEPGSRVADVTFGAGVFWRKVEPGLYDLHATDIKSGVDCRALPYPDGSMDAVVLDPPYMEGFFRQSSRAGGGSHAALATRYSSGQESPGEAKYQAAVLAFYLDAAREAQRVLRHRGVLLVKCQDAVSAGRQHLTHVDIINALRERGMYAKDLFILGRANAPAVSRILRQVHARKAHSYLIVFTKEAAA